LHAIAAAITEGGKTAKKFKSTHEFSRALDEQLDAFVRAGSSPEVLVAWSKYSTYLLTLESEHGFQQAQDYHFELSYYLKAKRHDLIRDGPFNAEVYMRCVLAAGGKPGGRGGGWRGKPTAATPGAPRGGKPRRGRLVCSHHGRGGHASADCYHLKGTKPE
jgi:hypothetical protein